MQRLGRSHPFCGYGGRFQAWLTSGDPRPYYSFGNGSAMRVSGCAYAAASLDEVKELSRKVTEVTHNHPEGLKGAEAVAVAVYMARTGSSQDEIRACMSGHYYPLDFTLDSIRGSYRFDVTCQGSVPQALEAFLESTSFEDAVRNSISLGGDSDTIAAMAGSIAEAYWGVPKQLRLQAESCLDNELHSILERFESIWPGRKA
jgi:type I restriction enzyme M protein